MTKVEGGGVPAGTQLNGIYEIEQRIAIGGMGEVYSGRVIQTGDKVAIKMILPEHANNQIILDLFRREASTLHNLYHEAIVRYYVFSVDPVLNRPYLSMEFAAGPSLGERIQEGGPLAEPEMSVLRRRIAGGLQAAHRLGIVHRDISPDNIILVDGEMERAKIIDFGIARSTTHEGTLIGSGFAGKLNYVSPEQLGLAGGEVTGKSDIYSLGLVFAEAAIGHPLPMGGSQVEVIEKRRTVPDLSPVPAWIRPLIERMVQPDPADRPADMQAIADWAPMQPEPTTINLGAHANRQAPGPAAARAEPASRTGKRGPWLWLGLGGTGLAAAVMAGFVLLGEDSDKRSQTDAVAEGDILLPVADASDDPLLAPDGFASIAAPVESASLPKAAMGERYSWTSDRFDYEGDQEALTFSTDGTIPLGVAVHAEDGAARLSGTPVEPGDFMFDIVARAPEGGSARMSVRLAVADATDPDDDPIAPAPDLAAGSSTESAADMPSESAASAAPDRAKPEAHEPQIAFNVPDGLVPASEDSLDDLAAGEAGLVPEKGSSAPALAPGGGADALPELPAPDGEPLADDRADPQQAEASAPVSADADGNEVIARIPPPDNLPPQIVTSRAEPVTVVSGESIRADLAAYTDEEGPGALDLHVDGDLPDGLRIELSESGVAELRGRPTEFGEYSFRVATIDPHGLVSQPLVVNLVIAPPSEEQPIRNYIVGYRGGDCFLSRPIELGPKLARVEIFAPESRVQSVIDFDMAFKRTMGFEADIGMRPISSAQCPLIQTLDRMPAGMLDENMTIQLDHDEILSGEELAGRIRGGEGVRLFLHDDDGGQTDLSPYMRMAGSEAEFAVPITGKGPQLLIAARPVEGGSLDHVMGLGALLDAAGQGEAALSVGFFLLK